MGPNDPFKIAPAPPREPADDKGNRPAIREAAGPGLPENSESRLAVLMGLASGVGFGVLVLIFGLGAGLLVMLFGGLGALGGWFGYSLSTGRLNLAAAWRALRGSDAGGRY